MRITDDQAAAALRTCPACGHAAVSESRPGGICYEATAVYMLGDDDLCPCTADHTICFSHLRAAKLRKRSGQLIR